MLLPCEQRTRQGPHLARDSHASRAPATRNRHEKRNLGADHVKIGFHHVRHQRYPNSTRTLVHCINKQFAVIVFAELQYGFDSEETRQTGRPAVPQRRGRTSVEGAPADHNAAGDGVRKGARAASEMHSAARQTRDDRKAKTPDVDAKKRGKSPFKYYLVYFPL